MKKSPKQSMMDPTVRIQIGTIQKMRPPFFGRWIPAAQTGGRRGLKLSMEVHFRTTAGGDIP